MRAERGQALVEMVAGVPLVLLMAMVVLQLLAAGHAAVLAGSAAEAGALARAGGGDVRAAVERALPGRSRGKARIEARGGVVTVRVEPRSLLPAVGRRLAVAREASVELP